MFNNSQYYIVQLWPPGSQWHIQEAVAAGHAGIARRQRQRSSYFRRDWWTPQTHCRHVMGRPANSVGWHHLLRLSGMPDDHRHPASHQTTPDSVLSLVVVTPEHSTVSAQHHAAAVTRPRGSSPFPCAGPSTLGYD